RGAQTQPIAFTYLGPTSSNGAAVLTLGGSQRPPAPTLGVFEAAPRPADRVPFAFLGQIAAVARVTHGAGRLDLRRARLLATGIGPAASRLYAAPTSRGWLCYLVAPPRLTPNCLRQLDHGLFLEVVDRDGP